MADEYDFNDFDNDISKIGDEMYGEYNPEEDIYKQMFQEFSKVDEEKSNVLSSGSDEFLFKDDILLQINLEEEINKDDRDINDMIDRGLETRFFQNDPNSFLNSRVGMAERIGQEQTLGTIIQGQDKLAKRQEKINRMNLNNQQIFSINFDKVCSKYGIEKNRVYGLLDLVLKSQFYEYKNPSGILFGFLCLKGKNISETQLDNVYQKYASQENISILDLVRYARFIKSLY
jgi:hypothetical protein